MSFVGFGWKLRCRYSRPHTIPKYYWFLWTPSALTLKSVKLWHRERMSFKRCGLSRNKVGLKLEIQLSKSSQTIMHHGEQELILRMPKQSWKTKHYHPSVVKEYGEYRVVQKNSCMFESSRPLSAHWPRQPMHSQSALTEHVSLNLARFFLLDPVHRWKIDIAELWVQF